MSVTRRGLFKRALSAGVLALVPSLPGLPKVAEEECIVGRVVTGPAPQSHFTEFCYSTPGPAKIVRKETPRHRYAINNCGEWMVYDSPISWPTGTGLIARGLSEEEMQEYLDCWEGEVREE
jgi:hypothetical protein